MALTKFEKDMSIIQKLDDEPNDVGGLTAAELKAKFDEGGEAIKEYINGTLVPNVVPNSTTVNGHPLSDNVTVTKEDVGLGNVDNTSDEDKPISTAQQAALDAKANKADVIQKDNVTPYTPTQPYHPATKDYTDKSVAGAVMGQVPDGSITDKKLANDSVTEEKLSRGIRKSVTEDFPNHIADKTNPHGVTAEQVPYDNSRTELESDTAQGAIDELYARMYGDLKVQVQVYETGTTTPISGVIVTGVVSETGGVCYANEDGIAIGYILSDAESATATVKVGTDYIDLTGQSSKQVTVTKGVTAHATIYATRVSNPSGKIETFTSSTQKMFTNKVARVDVHCVGAGAGGGRGRAYWDNRADKWASEGGVGGGGGHNRYVKSVSFTPNSLFSIVVGAKGKGAASATGNGDNAVSKGYGTKGGNSSALGVTASGGAINATRGAFTVDKAAAEKAIDSTTHLFGESSQSVVPGGDGGGGAAADGFFFIYDESSGGSPGGGNGGSVTSSGTINFGSSAKGNGGGGGGGAAFISSGSGNCKGGGDGGDGIVYVRWFYE